MTPADQKLRHFATSCTYGAAILTIMASLTAIRLSRHRRRTTEPLKMDRVRVFQSRLAARLQPLQDQENISITETGIDNLHSMLAKHSAISGRMASVISEFLQSVY